MFHKLRKIIGVVLAIWGGVRAVVDLLASIDATRSFVHAAYVDIIATPASRTLTITIIVVGLALLLYEPTKNAWNRGKDKIEKPPALQESKSNTKLPEYRPRVFPVAYGKNEKRGSFGLFVRNPGYDALQVHIPSVSVRPSAYVLTFPEQLSLLSEREGGVFFEAWLEDQTNALPGLDGGSLHEVMRKSNVDSVEFSIYYKDTDFLGYMTKCIIERTNRIRSGLEVRALGQELIPYEAEGKHELGSFIPLENSDPRVYVEVSNDERMFERTTFILNNQGGSTAHNIRISPIEIGGHKATFKPLASLAVGYPRDLFPHIEDANPFSSQNLLTILMAEWESQHVRPFPEILTFPMAIDFEDFAKKHPIRGDVMLSYYPLREIYARRHAHESPPRSFGAILEVTKIEFRRLS